MKNSELQKKSTAELQAHAGELKKQIAGARLAVKTGANKNTAGIKKLKAELAQTLTLLSK